MVDRHEQELRALLERIAGLNPDAGEIGEGMLRHIVAEAERLLGERPSQYQRRITLPK